eukprot:TRINITY_DN8879_c0_g1_i1.p2 TRINITY_DN8879_c0_g1~~TRINITY_DN8879_c0_g1_i1.p2  ORF type:complete len:152 (-),score=24.61 TRINITY_DN8879_c0_g1_i1:953-1408(-)
MVRLRLPVVSEPVFIAADWSPATTFGHMIAACTNDQRTIVFRPPRTQLQDWEEYCNVSDVLYQLYCTSSFRNPLVQRQNPISLVNNSAAEVARKMSRMSCRTLKWSPELEEDCNTNEAGEPGEGKKFLLLAVGGNTYTHIWKFPLTHNHQK